MPPPILNGNFVLKYFNATANGVLNNEPAGILIGNLLRKVKG